MRIVARGMTRGAFMLTATGRLLASVGFPTRGASRSSEAMHMKTLAHVRGAAILVCLLAPSFSLAQTLPTVAVLSTG